MFTIGDEHRAQNLSNQMAENIKQMGIDGTSNNNNLKQAIKSLLIVDEVDKISVERVNLSVTNCISIDNQEIVIADIIRNQSGNVQVLQMGIHHDDNIRFDSLPPAPVYNQTTDDGKSSSSDTPSGTDHQEGEME